MRRGHDDHPLPSSDRMGPVAKQRGSETLRDMVLSLVVLLGGVAVVTVLIRPGHHGPAVQAIDTTETFTAFADQAPYRPYMPSGLPAYWKATSVNTTVPGQPVTTAPGGRPAGAAAVAQLTVGYVIDRSAAHRTFAELSQTNVADPVRVLLGEATVPAGSVDVRGVAWQVRRDSHGHLALTRAAGAATVVVSDGGGKGGASQADLEVLAQALTPVRSAAPLGN
jgi:Protein of unknown function (DUF4245)